MCKLKLIFDSLLTFPHCHPPPPAHPITSQPPTHLKNNKVLLSCPVLTQLLLITHKVYIKAGQIYRSDANRQGKGIQKYL